MPHEGRESIRRLLQKHEACPEAIEWAADKGTLQELWVACREPEWMLWSLDQLGFRHDAKLRAFAAACARRHLDLLAEPRAVQVLEIAEAVAAGHAPESVLLGAWNEVRVAASDAARRPDWSAARAAAVTTVSEAVRIDAMDAARGASMHGRRAAAWHVGAVDAPIAEAEWQANELRRILARDAPLILERAREALIA